MAQMGMDVEAVENVGRQLKQTAMSVDQIVGGLDKTVSGLLQLWDGADAQRLVQSWPTFRKSLITAQASVAGLGQSALNNASEQRDASKVKGSGGGAAGPAAPAQVSPGPGSGSDTGSSDASSAEFAGWRSHYPDGTSAAVDYDKSNGIQCVDLIKQYTSDLYGPSAVVPANGDQVWANYGGTGHFDQISAQDTPQPGDIVCIDAWPAHMGSPENPYGHTAIVDHVDANGNVYMVQQSGSEQSRGIFVTELNSFYKPYVQGYLRPKVAA
ncbi:MAG: hypothetical protein JWP75_3447 [Frondihabitans sp.]|jgi:uncharacterized protein YukE|nr:hypothetical protein [Frondihabitans sp.]